MKSWCASRTVALMHRLIKPPVDLDPDPDPSCEAAAPMADVSARLFSSSVTSCPQALIADHRCLTMTTVLLPGPELMARISRSVRASVKERARETEPRSGGDRPPRVPLAVANAARCRATQAPPLKDEDDEEDEDSLEAASPRDLAGGDDR